MSKEKLVENKIPFKIDAGCGPNPKAGYIGVDTQQYGKKDIIQFNLEDIPEKKLPFYDNSISEVWCSHTLEHVDNPMQVIEEFHRVLIPGGKLIIKVPYFAHHTANVPIHKNYWSFRSQMFFDGAYFETHSKWKNLEVSHTWGSSSIGDIINLPFELLIKLVGSGLYERFFCYIRPIFEIKFEMRKGE